MTRRTISPRDIAHSLHERGANVIPLMPKSKEPAGRWAHWATRPQSRADVDRLIGPDATCNIAALGGAHSQAVTDGWGYLAMLDCDSHDGLALGRALLRAATGGDTLTVLSQRGGHVWFRTPQPVKTFTWQGGELRGFRSYCAAPGSVHPSGALYRWADESVPIAFCDDLPGIRLEYVERERLPRLASAILRGDKDIIGRYATRSEVDAALILSLVNAGATFERVRALYIASSHDKHLDPADRDFDKRLMCEYMRARNAGDRPEYAEAIEAARRVKAWALGAVDELGDHRVRDVNRRVLLAHCERAERSGRGEWHLSRRDVEQSARVSAITASKATHRLIDAGILARGRAGTVKSAQAYRFGPMCTDYSTSPHPPECGEVVHSVHDSPNSAPNPAPPDVAGHRAFEHSALGRVAGRIFAACLAPATEAEIAASTGYSRRTVRKHLAFMMKLEMLGWRDGNRVQALPETLDSAARFFEADKVERNRIGRIERERQAHRARLTGYKPIQRAGEPAKE